jgi:hypothetical protein
MKHLVGWRGPQQVAVPMDRAVAQQLVAVKPGGFSQLL